MKHQTFYLTVLGVAFMTAALISDVSDCNGAPPPGSRPRPSGPSAPPSRPGGSSGGRVIRKVTTDTHTGKVIKSEPMGPTSPIHRTYQPEPSGHPGPGPGRFSGGPHGHNPPPPPRPYYNYPYYSNGYYSNGYYPNYYPSFPAYPTLPGFPPPPDYWPGYIYNGLPFILNANVNVTPSTNTNIHQLGLFEVYDSSETLCGSLLIYYNSKNKKLGGYFNPAGTKNTCSVQGIISTVNEVETALFTVDDQNKTECAVPVSALISGDSASGIMLIPSKSIGADPEGSTFTLKRLK